MKRFTRISALFLSIAITVPCISPSAGECINTKDYDLDFDNVEIDENNWEYIPTTNIATGEKSYSLWMYPIADVSTLEIPASYNGLEVTQVEVSNYDFEDYHINSLIFPDTISDAYPQFENIPTLKTLTFGSDEIHFDRNSYFRQTGIEELSLPKIIPTEPAHTYNIDFRENPKLKRVIFRDSSDTITVGNEFFKDCPKLEEFVLPDTCKMLITEINSFSNTGLKKLDFSVETDISSTSFANCEALSSVTFRKKCKVGGNSFFNCHSLTDVTFEEPPTLTIHAFSGCDSLTNINIDTDFDFNGAGFSECPTLRSINSKNVFDETTGDFVPEYRDMIFRNFNAAQNTGFINDYIQAQIQKVIDENITPDMTDIQKLRIAHDWICDNAIYAEDEKFYNNPEYHTDASVFLNDISVCEGYARAMNLFCHALGLPSCYVNSSSHAWVIVKLDGHWFHTDVTWDDYLHTINWFLCSDDELVKAGGAHSRWNIKKPSSMHGFQETELPKCTCPMGDVNTDGKVGAADLVTYSRFLLGAQDIPKDDIILSDMNYDGSYDSFDMVKLRKKAIRQ